MIDKEEFLYNPNLCDVNQKNKLNGLDLLLNIRESKIKVCFFDPQYRGILDHLNYGNEGKLRCKGRSSLSQMSEDQIMTFIKEIDRILVPTGHLFLWIDKYHLCNGVTGWLTGTNLNIVDLIIWDKGKLGMGYRSRRKSEYCIVIQKTPKRAKGIWKTHNIPDVWEEKVQKNHPHTKPINLQKVLIEAVTDLDDVIVDPAAGGFSVLEACIQCQRYFLGCDLIV